ncbi:hypothetical protein DXG01_008110 [Tephrocybe rancida]|nr:hypothetical protein DXG01_008110 [Tephrocybe rancida]
MTRTRHRAAAAAPKNRSSSEVQDKGHSKAQKPKGVKRDVEESEGGHKEGSPLSKKARTDKAHTGVIERGHLYFFYRPKVQHEEAHSLDDAKNLHMLLVPRPPKFSTYETSTEKLDNEDDEAADMQVVSPGADAVPAAETVNELKKRFRLILIGKKQLPDPETGEQGLGEKTYETKTRGTRHEEPARLAARGAYAIVNNDPEVPSKCTTHFGYHISHPSDIGDVQKELGISKAASFVLQVKNPLAPTTDPRQGHGKGAEYPQEIMTGVFGKGGTKGRQSYGLRFVTCEMPELLDYKGAELLLIAARDGDEGLETSLGEGRGQALTELEEKESHEAVEILFKDSELGADAEAFPSEPLKGEWIYLSSLKVQDEGINFVLFYSTMSKPIVLVTGVSGFVGSHVVLELLRKGYAVRGTARSGRLASLQPISIKYPDFTLVHVEDISKGDLTDSLKGVAGVIHVASPLVGRASKEDSLASALDGTLNVLRQAVAAGVNKVVLTSSIATLLDPDAYGKGIWEGVTFTSSHYGRATKEDLLSGKHDAVWVYLASKILAEEAAWEFASSHPQLDLTTVNPPFIYGPIAPGFPAPRATELGTSRFIYAALSGTFPMQVAPLFCDVRDTARAHVAAFERHAAPTSINRKRYLICGGVFTWKDMVEHLGKALPELRPRLPTLDKAQPLPGPISTMDARPAAEDLGMVDYIRWEKTVEDAVQSLLEVEKTWQKAS